ncbi:MAG: glutathione S-transferase C-terminal domain-containing protein, partial [Nitrososphaera sp.]|nr:glutathione S-transferase C-terminal domain-containing protein [Nitrososphaera sp.]
YLDEQYRYPKYPSLLPESSTGRAFVRQLAHVVACDIHPLQNPRVNKHIASSVGLYFSDDWWKEEWVCPWIHEGLEAYEKLITDYSGDGFSYGDSPTIADCCLIPQIYSARRFGCCLDHYPNILKIHGNCMRIKAFENAAPENQPDAVNEG